MQEATEVAQRRATWSSVRLAETPGCALFPAASLVWVGMTGIAVQLRGADIAVGELVLEATMIALGLVLAADVRFPPEGPMLAFDVVALVVVGAVLVRCTIGMVSTREDDGFATLLWAAGISGLLPALAVLISHLVAPLAPRVRLAIAAGIVGVGLAVTTLLVMTSGALREVSIAVPFAVLMVAGILLLPLGGRWGQLAGPVALAASVLLRGVAWLGVLVAALGSLLAVAEGPQTGFEGASPAGGIAVLGACLASIGGYAAGLLRSRHGAPSG